jgi:hypothetical protein
MATLSQYYPQKVSTGVLVYISGNQTISGIKNFINRPTVNGTQVALIGEGGGSGNIIISGGGSTENVVFTTGSQNISGQKNFFTRPTVNNTGVLLTGEIRSGFNGNRAITRQSFPANINVGGTDVGSFLNNLFFPFNPATISLNTSPYNTIREFGTTYSNIPFQGSITANGETQISNLTCYSNDTIITAVANPSFGSFDLPTSLSLTQNAFLRVAVTGNNNGSPTSIISAAREIRFEAPYYWGSGQLGLTPAQITGRLTKVNGVGKATINQFYNTIDSYAYLVYPNEAPSLWGSTLLDIRDPSNFTMLTSFISYNTGIQLLNGSTLNYVVYRSKDPASLSNFRYTFTFN